MTELESALEFVICFPGFDILNESVPGKPIFCVVTEDNSTSCHSLTEAVVSHARSLGWPGLQSEGGKEQDGSR